MAVNSAKNWGRQKVAATACNCCRWHTADLHVFQNAAAGCSEFNSWCLTSTETSYGLLGTAEGGGGAPIPRFARTLQKADRPPPEQEILSWWGTRKCGVAHALRNLYFNRCREHSHKDSVHRNSSVARQSIRVREASTMCLFTQLQGRLG